MARIGDRVGAGSRGGRRELRLLEARSPCIVGGLFPVDLDRARRAERIVDRHRAVEGRADGGIRRQVRRDRRLGGGAAAGGGDLGIDRPEARSRGIADDVALGVGAPALEVVAVVDEVARIVGGERAVARIGGGTAGRRVGGDEEAAALDRDVSGIGGRGQQSLLGDVGAAVHRDAAGGVGGRAVRCRHQIVEHRRRGLVARGVGVGNVVGNHCQRLALRIERRDRRGKCASETHDKTPEAIRTRRR